MKRFDAIGFGALNYDIIDRVPDITRGDNEVVATETMRTAGGSAANTVYALAKLGLQTAFMGAVGNDIGGRVIQDSFKEAGVSRDWIELKDGTPTGEAVVATDGVDRSLRISPGANALYSPLDLDRAKRTLIPHARLLHLTSFANEAQVELQIDLARNAPEDLVVSFAPGQLYADKGTAKLEELFARSDYVFCNEREIMTVMGRSYDGIMRVLAGHTYVEAAGEYMEQFPNCRALIVTFGAGKPEYLVDAPPDSLTALVYQGEPIYCCNIFTPDQEPIEVVQQPQLPGNVVDTTGAGDAFTAGFLYGILNESSLEQSAQIGDMVARFSITGLGARGNLPEKYQLEAAGSGLLEVIAKKGKQNA